MIEYNWIDISEYRQKEIEEAVDVIHDIFKDKSPDYFKGAMAMFKKILLLPKKLCAKSEEDFIADMIAKDFKSVEINLLRRVVRE